MKIIHLSIDKLKAMCPCKRIILTVCVVLVFCMVVGGSIAWLTSIVESVNNRFNPAEVTITIIEDFDGYTKGNVQIENTGNVPAYIRVALVPAWVDEDGNVVAQEASLADCTITWGAGVSLLNSEAPTITPGAGVSLLDSEAPTVTPGEAPSEDTEEPTWFQGSDGYFYCIAPVPPVSEAPKNYTPILIKECIVNESEYGHQYDFELRIVASAVQAIPKDAVLDAWSAVAVGGSGNLELPTPTPEPTLVPTPIPTWQTQQPEQPPEETQGGN